MPTISVTIAGRAYRIACGEGEEARLQGLAGDLDARIAAMRAQFGEIGDMRLQVMAALSLADELAEMRERAAAAAAEATTLRETTAVVETRHAAEAARITAAIEAMAARVAALVQTVAGPATSG